MRDDELDAILQNARTQTEEVKQQTRAMIDESYKLLRKVEEIISRHDPRSQMSPPKSDADYSR